MARVDRVRVWVLVRDKARVVDMGKAPVMVVEPMAQVVDMVRAAVMDREVATVRVIAVMDRVTRVVDTDKAARVAMVTTAVAMEARAVIMVVATVATVVVRVVMAEAAVAEAVKKSS